MSVQIPSSATSIGTGAFSDCGCNQSLFRKGVTLINCTVDTWFPSAAPTTPVPATSTPTDLPTTSTPTAPPTTSILTAAPNLGPTRSPSLSDPKISLTGSPSAIVVSATDPATSTAGTGLWVVVGLTVAAVVLLLVVGGTFWVRRRRKAQATKLFGASPTNNPAFLPGGVALASSRLAAADHPAIIGGDPDVDGYLMLGDQVNLTTVPLAVHGQGQEHGYECGALASGPRAASPEAHGHGQAQAQDQEHAYEYGALATAQARVVNGDPAAGGGPGQRYQLFLDAAQPTYLAPTALYPEQKQPAYLLPTPLGTQQQPPRQHGEPQYAEVEYATSLGAQQPQQQGEPQYAEVEYSQIGSNLAR